MVGFLEFVDGREEEELFGGHLALFSGLLCVAESAAASAAAFEAAGVGVDITAVDSDAAVDDSSTLGGRAEVRRRGLVVVWAGTGLVVAHLASVGRVPPDGGRGRTRLRCFIGMKSRGIEGQGGYRSRGVGYRTLEAAYAWG